MSGCGSAFPIRGGFELTHQKTRRANNSVSLDASYNGVMLVHRSHKPGGVSKNLLTIHLSDICRNFERSVNPLPWRLTTAREVCHLSARLCRSSFPSMCFCVPTRKRCIASEQPVASSLPKWKAQAGSVSESCQHHCSKIPSWQQNRSTSPLSQQPQPQAATFQCRQSPLAFVLRQRRGEKRQSVASRPDPHSAGTT